MKFWSFVTLLDRRWIYLTIGVIIVGMQFVHLGQKVPISPELQSLYGFTDTLKQGDFVWVACDYDPAVMAELQPMAIAYMSHAFSKGCKVIVSVARPEGVGLALSAIEIAARRNNMKEDSDWVFLGFNPAYYQAMQLLGLDIRLGWNADHRGKKLDDIPMLKTFHNYRDLRIVTCLSGSDVTAWMEYAHERFNANVSAGVTGVMATGLYPYWQTRQLVGIIGGLKGAAEYETLIKQPGSGIGGMDAQSVAHIAIIFFIIIGNLGFFFMKRADNRAGLTKGA